MVPFSPFSTCSPAPQVFRRTATGLVQRASCSYRATHCMAQPLWAAFLARAQSSPLTRMALDLQTFITSLGLATVLTRPVSWFCGVTRCMARRNTAVVRGMGRYLPSRLTAQVLQTSTVSQHRLDLCFLR